MKYVIIGAGAAGIMAAKTIRSQDKQAEILMISSDEHVHSRCMLHKYISGERQEAELNFAGEDFFEKYHIDWIKGTEVLEIKEEEKQLVLKNIETGELDKVSYDKLLIATGANSFIPPVWDFRQAKNVFGLRHLIDAKNIRDNVKADSKVLIVGSGLVGLDAAYGLLERGIDVTVVEMADRILPIQLDETGAAAYQKLFENAGCKFYLEKKASETIMNQEQKIEAVILDDGTKIACDVIIVAAGVRPAIQCAQGSSVEGERFLEVNNRMQTKNEDIYAAGDVTGKSGIWPNAQKMGQIAGYNMLGIQMEYIDTYAMKNTINFFGLPTLSLGRGQVMEGDEVIIEQDRNNYRKAILRDGKLDSITLQGNIDYCGIYQYLIKNQIVLPKEKTVFEISFADYYGIGPDGQYCYIM